MVQEQHGTSDRHGQQHGEGQQHGTQHVAAARPLRASPDARTQRRTGTDGREKEQRQGQTRASGSNPGTGPSALCEAWTSLLLGHEEGESWKNRAPEGRQRNRPPPAVTKDGKLKTAREAGRQRRGWRQEEPGQRARRWRDSPFSLAAPAPAGHIAPRGALPGLVRAGGRWTPTLQPDRPGSGSRAVIFCRVTLSEGLCLPEPRCPHLSNGGNDDSPAP